MIVRGESKKIVVPGLLEEETVQAGHGPGRPPFQPRVSRMIQGVSCVTLETKGGARKDQRSGIFCGVIRLRDVALHGRPQSCTGYGISPLPPRSPSGLHNPPLPQALTKAAAMGAVEATSAEGVRSQAVASALAAPS